MGKKQKKRLDEISQIIENQRSVHVDKLAKQLNVSENTIRRDLVQLESENPFISRFHGGAVINGGAGQPAKLDYAHRETLNLDEKKRIASKALSHIGSDDSFILDSGTTGTILARLFWEECLGNSRNNQIITPSSTVFDCVKKIADPPPILSGGFYDERTQGYYGLPAERFFSEIHTSVLFLGVMGISTKGASINSFKEVPVKKSMLRATDKIIVLADSSKIGATCIAQIAALGEIDLIITGCEAKNRPETEKILEAVSIEFA